MFIEPDRKQLDAARALGAPVVELHTGAYANAAGAAREKLLKHIHNARGVRRRSRPGNPCRPWPDL